MVTIAGTSESGPIALPIVVVLAERPCKSLNGFQVLRLAGCCIRRLLSMPSLNALVILGSHPLELVNSIL
jgi:hypothetical protein